MFNLRVKAVRSSFSKNPTTLKAQSVAYSEWGSLHQQFTTIFVLTSRQRSVQPPAISKILLIQPGPGSVGQVTASKITGKIIAPDCVELVSS